MSASRTTAAQLFLRLGGCSGSSAALARRCRVRVTRQRPLPVAGQHRASNCHQALDPAQKARNPAITADDELIRIAVVPETGRTVDAVPHLRRCVKLDGLHPAHVSVGVVLAGEARA